MKIKLQDFKNESITKRKRCIVTHRRGVMKPHNDEWTDFFTHWRGKKAKARRASSVTPPFSIRNNNKSSPRITI